MSYPCPHCSTVASQAHDLRTHLTSTRASGGHELSAESAAAVITNIKTDDPATSTPLPPQSPSSIPVESSAGTLLQPGHWHSLALLENAPNVLDTLAVYEDAIGHPVYLRPTANGLTVMSLDPSTTSMVGVGGGNCCIRALPASRDSVASAALAYRAKIAAMRRDSPEERYVVARIRAALANGLELGGDLLFLHQEWRFPGHDKLDVLALDSRTGALVVIEAKKSERVALDDRDGRGRTAAEQAAGYAALLVTHSAECTPFFQRLATALGRIYRPDREAVRVDGTATPRWEIWWPDTSGVPHVAGTTARDLIAHGGEDMVDMVSARP